MWKLRYGQNGPFCVLVLVEKRLWARRHNSLWGRFSQSIWTIEVVSDQLSWENTQEMEIAMSKVSKVCVEPEIWPPPWRPRGQNPHLSNTYGGITQPIGVIEPEWKFPRTGHIQEMNLEPSISTNIHLEAEIFPLPWKPRKIQSAARIPFTENFQWAMLGSWLEIDLDWGITVHLQ